MRGKGKRTKVTPEQMAKILEWEKAYQAVPPAKVAAYQIGIPHRTMYYYLAQHRRRKLMEKALCKSSG